MKDDDREKEENRNENSLKNGYNDERVSFEELLKRIAIDLNINKETQNDNDYTKIQPRDREPDTFELRGGGEDSKYREYNEQQDRYIKATDAMRKARHSNGESTSRSSNMATTGPENDGNTDGQQRWSEDNQRGDNPICRIEEREAGNEERNEQNKARNEQNEERAARSEQEVQRGIAKDILGIKKELAEFLRLKDDEKIDNFIFLYDKFKEYSIIKDNNEVSHDIAIIVGNRIKDFKEIEKSNQAIKSYSKDSQLFKENIEGIKPTIEKISNIANMLGEYKNQFMDMTKYIQISKIVDSPIISIHGISYSD